MKPALVTTADGSHSLYVAELSEHYHSVHGAIQESEHVFINAGLAAVSLQIEPLYILEMGFGTGLNAFLSYLTNLNHLTRPIFYTTIEAYPIDAPTALQLNYAQQLNATAHLPVFETMHYCAWNEPVRITPNFTLTKINSQLQLTQLPAQQFHLVYFDAFAPSAQPELWTEAIFDQIYQSLQPGGILTTYCAKGVVKRALRSVGFTVYSLPGPKGKREMTKAIKPA